MARDGARLRRVVAGEGKEVKHHRAALLATGGLHPVASTTLESTLSIVMLGAFIWSVAFLPPKARRERDRFGLICSVIFAIVALGAWLLIGVGTRSR
jgi:hypothetical protein